MQSKAKTVKEYLDEIPPERKEAFNKLRNTILGNLPPGFAEVMDYGMIGYVVPHSIYPDGYHTDRKKPLPFAYLAAQKNFIALYHMGIYGDARLSEWFISEYEKECRQKPDIGKSCIRFKKPEQIPFELIGRLMHKISVDDWIKLYKVIINKSKKV